MTGPPQALIMEFFQEESNSAEWILLESLINLLTTVEQKDQIAKFETRFCLTAVALGY